MAQFSTRGRHRRARRGAVRGTSTMIGLAAVTVAGVGAAAVPAAAQPEARVQAPTGEQATVVSFAGYGDQVREDIAEQADAQHKAADAAEEKAEKARKAAAARKKAAERERASRGSGRTALKAAARPQSSGWTTPVASYRFSAQYGQAGPWSSGHHTGTDFVVPVGTPVHAVGPGTVVTASFDGSYGNNVVIRHADGMYTQYAHMSSLGVSAGQTVSAGQQIGLSGATGNVTGPHVHFEARTTPEYGSDTNPLAYLRSHGVRV